MSIMYGMKGCNILKKRIAIIGSTGSIGTQALDILANYPDHFEIKSIAAYQNIDVLEQQIMMFSPAQVVVINEDRASQLNNRLLPNDVKVKSGREALVDLVTDQDVDVVLMAVVGIAGLEPTIAALRAGKVVALANKEVMVTGGQIVNQLIKEFGGKVIPVDSEHSAIFQAIQGCRDTNEVNKIILTASGGPFRGYNRDKLKNVTLEDALKHPNWEMGDKITIDSATLMNKGLEVIEAKWLFDIDVDRIDVVVHPQSIIHSMVEFIDGSVMAQMGVPDMRLPILYAMTYPYRFETQLKSLNLVEVGSLTFEERNLLLNSFSLIIQSIKENKFNPVLIKNTYVNNYLSFHALDINQFGKENKLYLDSISQVLNKYYIKNDTLDRISQKSQSIKKSIQTKLDRSLNKLSKQKQELLESQDREKYKIYADLISANIYKIEKGAKEVELDNFYTETMEKIRIPLDERFSPAKNAQRYYKKYSKLKNAHSLLLRQIPETKEEIDYLENVLISIDNCTEIIELSEIKEELIKEGYLKGKVKKRKKKNPISKPYHYISSDGFHIYVGKNNKQNDYLTLRFAHKEDLWFHVQNMPGSHVIIKGEGKKISHTALEEAAILAAYYSKGKASTNVAVDYTERKNVKKPKNAKTGMVIYEDFSTIFVTPNKEQIENRVGGN